MWRKWLEFKLWLKIKIHQGVVREVLNEFNLSKTDGKENETVYDFIRHQVKGRNAAIDEINNIKDRIGKIWKISSG